MNRVAFLIDGFNVYHSIVQLREDTGHSTKWLNLYSLCFSYIPALFGREHKLESVYYFTALAEHYRSRNPEKIGRHKAYIKCLESTGIEVIYGRFKWTGGKYEEKQTDVAIAVKLLEIFYTDKCDTAVIISGDTDLIPALETCRNLFPERKVIFGFPYERSNAELSTLVPESFKIKQKKYKKHQFSNPVTLTDGNRIHKPSGW